LWLRYGIPSEIQTQVLAHLPYPIRGPLGRVFLKQAT
jgi:hypothetical protein